MTTDGAKTTHTHQDGTIWAGCDCRHIPSDRPLPQGPQTAAEIVDDLYSDIGWDSWRDRVEHPREADCANCGQPIHIDEVSGLWVNVYGYHTSYNCDGHHA